MSAEPTRDVFNLIRASWLPVRRRSGLVEHIPPWRVTDRIGDDPFVAFAWPRPDFNGASHELLIGLLSTAAAPEDEDEWQDWWEKPPSPKAIEERFDVIAHAFDLDGPGPRFQQDLDPLEDVESKEKEVTALLIDAPGEQTLKNNADLFVKRSNAPVLGRAAVAMALHTLSAYAPPGGSGHRTSLRGGGPMTTLIVSSHATYGDTLWGRLWPNVETKEQARAREARPEPVDSPESIFPWLGPTRTSNPKADGRPTTPADVHPLQVYWGMPRRIRLIFGETDGRRCGLTGAEASVVVGRYRTKKYGTNYSEGFRHPLTPYYTPKTGAAKLAVHPQPGGISYRHWPGLVVESDDRLHDPAQAIRHGWVERSHASKRMRFSAYGYDMDNMKGRAWIESEMPLIHMDDEETHALIEYFIQLATKGAGAVARLLIRSVKSALCNRPSEATGDYGFIEEKFYRETEQAFYDALREAGRMIEDDAGRSDDPSLEARERWTRTMETAALRLFGEHAPADGLEGRDMHRYVKAYFHLRQALRGYGKYGKSLFRDLRIATSEKSRTSK